MTDQSPVKLAHISATPTTGEGSLSPVILVHGITSWKKRWEGIMQELADKTGRKVYAIDARNHGDSERSEVFNFSILSKDLLHFMDTLDIPKACLVGHSMGGCISMITALAEPQRIERVVIEDVAPTKTNAEVCRFIANKVSICDKCITTSTLAESDDEVQRKTIDLLCDQFRPFTIDDEQQKRGMRKNLPLRRTETGYTYLINAEVIERSLRNPDALLNEYKGQSDAEILFLLGGGSYLESTKSKDDILKHFPNAEIFTFENVGHGILEVREAEYVQKVVAFLTRP